MSLFTLFSVPVAFEQIPFQSTFLRKPHFFFFFAVLQPLLNNMYSRQFSNTLHRVEVVAHINLMLVLNFCLCSSYLSIENTQKSQGTKSGLLNGEGPNRCSTNVC
jgi:hypothetical protein